MSHVRALLACLAALLAPLAAGAEVVRTERITASLLSEAAVAAPGDTVRVGLHLEIIDGWHTYWRNPGDSGAATSLDWRLPEGVAAGPIRWPHPEAIPYGPLVNYGYEDEVLHLVDVTVPADWPAGSPLRLEAEAFWLVCEELCIPESGTVALDLPTGPASEVDPEKGPLFERFAAALPQPAPFAVTAHGPEPLELRVKSGLAPGAEAHFFPYEGGVIDAAAAQPVHRDGDGFTLRLTPKASAAELAGVLVVSEILGPQRFSEAYAIEAPVAAAPVTASVPGVTLVAALGLALVGGLLLNLMPCVLPVLSMKALALVQHDDRGRARLEGLAYTAGVLATFIAVAGALIAARAAGAQIGWGFQLQSPLIVAGLAYLLFAVGLNLSGLFEIGGALGLGGRLAGRSGAVGAFAMGALAVVVATPCTAPFMATALGFALVQPPTVTLAVFAALGLGLALPFLLVSLVPALGRLLPRPGPWMIRLRQGLAFPMYASAAWLVWVLAQQAGPDAVLAVLAGAVLLAFGLWLAVPAVTRPGRIARGVGIAAVAGSLLLLAVPAGLRGGDAAAAETPRPGEAYSPLRLERALAGSGPVFVEMTAAWCITCQVNERVALSGAGFAELLARTGTTYLVGDWTNHDPEVSAFIADFDHPGVPLYVVWPAGGGPPEVLPQVLTPGLVARALERAAGRGFPISWNHPLPLPSTREYVMESGGREAAVRAPWARV